MNVRAIGTVGVLAVAIGVGAAAPASSGATAVHHATHHKTVVVTPADREAAHAYLIATEQSEEAQLANMGRSTSAVEALTGRISSECAHVLAGSPPAGDESESSGLLFQAQESPRAQGENNRQSRQRRSLKLELTFALDGSVKQANHDALAALLGALSPLKWSNHRLTALLHAIVVIGQDELALAPPPACADMRSWVASGYKTLTPASKEFEKATETLLIHAFEALALFLSSDVHKSFAQLLAPYESPADMALARRTDALNAQLSSAPKLRKATVKQLEANVGLPVPKPEPPVKHPPRKPAVVDRGRTAAGTRFVVRAQRAFHPFQSGCTTNVTFEEPSPPHHGALLDTFEGEESERCISQSHIRPEQRTRCTAGHLTVEASLRPAARTVRLLLSDHRTVTSPAIRVPPRLGGPVGVYYQAVRGPSPIPVSLTELDEHGNTLTVLKLNAVVECTKHPRKDFTVARLAHGSVPGGGPTFTIIGKHYRELGHVHFELQLSTQGNEELFGGGDHGGGIQSFGEGPEGDAAPHDGRPLFVPQTSTGCTPQPHEIVYGLLIAPRDKVLALVSGKLVPLRKVAIPASLHTHGALAYGAFSPVPTELLVTDAHGRTITGDGHFSEQARTTTETCEGEAEG
jgi:hypothetical protein